MKKLIALLCCVFLAGPVLAQDKGKSDDKKAAVAKKEPTEKQKAQQERMKACNQKAGDKKLEGDARKSFMSSCLKGEEPAAAAKPTSQQQKMADCNKQAAAKQVKGDERKAFMSSCLKG
jgi:hypothetical protein